MIPTLGEIHFGFAIDTQGYTIAIVGWFIVFLALVILVVIFTNIPNLIYYKSKKTQRVEKRTALKTEIGSDDYHISNEVSAAIAMSNNFWRLTEKSSETGSYRLLRRQPVKKPNNFQTFLHKIQATVS